ncbi:MAG: hypothetical protein RSB38_09180 [Oscillospiraceae bacterium]
MAQKYSTYYYPFRMKRITARTTIRLRPAVKIATISGGSHEKNVPRNEPKLVSKVKSFCITLKSESIISVTPSTNLVTNPAIVSTTPPTTEFSRRKKPSSKLLSSVPSQSVPELPPPLPPPPEEAGGGTTDEAGGGAIDDEAGGGAVDDEAGGGAVDDEAGGGGSTTVT